MLTPLPLKGWNLKPGSASLPSFGILPCILDAVTGKELIGGDVEGWLAVKHPWPSALRGVWNNKKVFRYVVECDFFFFSHLNPLFFLRTYHTLSISVLRRHTFLSMDIT